MKDKEEALMTDYILTMKNSLLSDKYKFIRSLDISDWHSISTVKAFVYSGNSIYFHGETCDKNLFKQ